MSLSDNLRRNIITRRSALGYSQEHLGHASGYSVKYIGRIEQGRQANATLSFVEAVAGALMCEPAELLSTRQQVQA